MQVLAYKVAKNKPCGGVDILSHEHPYRCLHKKLLNTKIEAVCTYGHMSIVTGAFTWTCPNQTVMRDADSVT